MTDAQLLEQFEQRTLPFELWTHQAHVRVAFIYLHPQLMTRHALRLFYSPKRRMDPQAKTTFVPPDLAPLPRRK